MSTVQIKKITSQGNPIYPATILDAVKDATAKITVDGTEQDNPTYGKTVREIITDNEKVTATALNELNTRVGTVADLKTSAKDSTVDAINELVDKAASDVLDGDSGYTIGGLSNGDSLEGLTAAEILDKILKPEYLPQFTDAGNPTLTYKGSLVGTVEVVTTLPAIADFTTSAGSIAKAVAGSYTATGGAGTCATVTLDSNTAGGSAGSASTKPGTATYKVTCDYAAGTTEVKTNKGNSTKYTSSNSTTLSSKGSDSSHTTGTDPYYIKAISGKSATKVFTFQYRFYATTATAGTASDQGLVASLSNKELTLKGQGAVGSSAFFDVPPTMSISKIQMYNTVSGKFEDTNVISSFATSTVTHNLPSGTAASYTRYAMNSYQDADFKIKLS